MTNTERTIPGTKIIETRCATCNMIMWVGPKLRPIPSECRKCRGERH